jgi:hypothetical protein
LQENKTFAAEFNHGMFWMLPAIPLKQFAEAKHWTVDVIAWRNLPSAYEEAK